MNGRGAWSPVGMPPGTVYYQLANPMVGSAIFTGGVDNGADPDAIAERAVNYGCRAIQIRINAMGYRPKTREDGIFDESCAKAVQWAQGQLKVSEDGSVGPQTAHALWHPRYRYFEREFLIPFDYLCGLAVAESGHDPGAVGYDSPDDKGIVQINTTANPSMPVPSMFFAISDPLKYAAERLQAAFQHYKSWDCAIASYNDPALANLWAQTGLAPNQDIQDYVTTVKAGC